jgi:cytochrome c-type biogenesis protein CcmE
MFGGAIIIVFLGVMAYLFTQTNVSYENNFDKVMQSGKTLRATGSWVKERNYVVDKQNNLLSFYIKDNQGNMMKVIYHGTIPNNFESSINIVVTGKYTDGNFQATDILTKCPSKYQDQQKQRAS